MLGCYQLLCSGVVGQWKCVVVVVWCKGIQWRFIIIIFSSSGHIYSACFSSFASNFSTMASIKSIVLR